MPVATLVLALVAVALPADVTTKWKSVKTGGEVVVEAKYPRWTGGTVASLASALVESDLAKEIRDMKGQWGKGNGTGRPSSLYVDADVDLATSTLISAALSYSPYTGGAHPGLYFKTFSVGIVNGKAKRLALADLFKPGVNVKNALGPLIIQDLLKQKASWVEDGMLVEPTDTILRNFTVRRQGIAFRVDPYEAGPWAQGPFTVVVRFTELRGVLDPKGPLKGMIR